MYSEANIRRRCKVCGETFFTTENQSASAVTCATHECKKEWARQMDIKRQEERNDILYGNRKLIVEKPEVNGRKLRFKKNKVTTNKLGSYRKVKGEDTNLCFQCPLLSHCNERVQFGIWVACEVPNKSDLLFITSSSFVALRAVEMIEEARDITAELHLNIRNEEKSITASLGTMKDWAEGMRKNNVQ